MIPHHFTVDVEEHFQVSAFEPWVPNTSWVKLESRVQGNVHRLLALLDDASATGTFFVLGWVAERYPTLARSIAEAGHEIASHGWGHRRVTHLTPDEFRKDVRRSKRVLEDQIGEAVNGYRAPSFSIVPGREWALDILIEEGFSYDSSLFPIRRPDGYGFPDAPPDPHTITRPSGSLLEFPPCTFRVGGMSLPAAGGAYFRILPYGLVSRALRQTASRGCRGTFYIHPWEIDPDQPRFKVPVSTRMRHYSGLRRTESRLRRLTREFRFTSIRSQSLPTTTVS